MTRTTKHSPKPWIQTPLIHSGALSRSAGCKIYLKLENLQPSGSFKSRGIGNLMRASFSSDASVTNGKDSGSRHFYSSSGGNAGLGCVHAAVALESPATIVIPTSTTEYMKSKLRNAGASEVIQHGKSWAEADRYLRETIIPEARARNEQAVYVPPFDAQEIWDGHATLIHELVEQLVEEEDQNCQIDGHRTSALDALVCSVGGGGLFCGMMQGLEDVNMHEVPVLAMETYGAESFSQALEAGHLVTLPAITSIATSLGARTVCQRALEYGQKDTVRSVVLTDKEAVDACERFADDERLLIEPACGVCVAVCYDGRLKQLLPDLHKDSKVVIVVCGGSNVSLKILEEWGREYV